MDVKDIDLQEIDIMGWEKRDRLWIMLEVHKLKVLRQHHDSQVVVY